MNQQNILYAAIAIGVALIGIGVYRLSNSQQIVIQSPSTPNTIATIAGKQFAVRSDQVWNDTGLNIKGGQKVTIQASGQINVGSTGNAADRWVGPDGWGYLPANDWTCNNHPCRYVNVSNSLGSLIGRIGKNGKPFEVGSYTTFSASDSGILYLGVDDSFSDDTGRMLPESELQRLIYYNNRREFTATVQIDGGQSTLNIPLNTPWTSTGITINAGQTLIAQATGKGVWKNASSDNPNSYPKSFEECDPDGTPPVDSKDYYANISSYPAADAYKGALIGKIGESGKPFKVGANFKSLINEAGTIYLGINDMRTDVDPTAFSDNSGTYTVQIAVR